MHVLSCSCSWHRSISKMTKIGPRICLQVSYHKFCGNAHEQTDACDLPATSFTGGNHWVMGCTVLSRWIHACNWSNYCDYNVRNSSFNRPRNRNSEVSQSGTHLNFDASIDHRQRIVGDMSVNCTPLPLWLIKDTRQNTDNAQDQQALALVLTLTLDVNHAIETNVFLSSFNADARCE